MSMNRIEEFFGSASNHFSNTIVTWEIEHFPIINCTQKLITSAVIQLHGPVETLWRMHLDMTKKNDMLLKLEMLPNNTNLKSVRVHWACSVSDENEKDSFSPERIFTFEQTLKLVTNSFSLINTLDMLRKKPFDILTIKCHMLLNFGLKLEFPSARVPGVKELSNDLVGLPKSFLYHDIVTKVGNEKFSLHKAMLSQYGVKIVHLLEQSSDMYIDFSISCEKAAASLFSYIYTGDLKYILSNPSIPTIGFAKHLGMSNLEKVFSLQCIKIASKFEFRRQTFSWTITHFNKVSRILDGPKFKIDDMESIFQLSLNIRESTDKMSRKSLVVEAKLIDTEKLLVTCLEFACGKNENQMLTTQKFYKVMGVGDKVAATLLKNDHEDCFLSQTIVIKFTAFIRIGEVISDVVESETTPAVINYERSFMNLCKMLRDLMNSAAYSDFHFEIGDQKIKAHKFLVAARSPLMKELFRRQEGLVSVKVFSCKKDVFDKFISYLYTGILTETDANKLIQLYELGSEYRVYGLESIVRSTLTKLVNDENMLNVLIFADNVEDDELKNVAIQNLLKDPSKLSEHRDHLKLLATKPSVYKQIQKLIAQQSP